MTDDVRVLNLRKPLATQPQPQPPPVWPFGLRDAWIAFRLSLEDKPGPYAAHQRAEADAELARIQRCLATPPRPRAQIVPFPDESKHGRIRIRD